MTTFLEPFLMDAVLHGRTDAVYALIEAGARVNEPRCDETAATPLLLACQEGHAEIVRTLLEAGAPVDQPIPDGRTPLIMACHHGHRNVVALLLAAGASLDEVSGTTPLVVACCPGPLDPSAHKRVREGLVEQMAPLAPEDAGRTEIVSLLLAAGADVDAPDADGITPMFAAVQYGHFGCVRLLSSYCASRSFIFDDETEDDADEFEELADAEALASREGHTDIHDWLVASRQWSTPLHHLEANVISTARAHALLRDGADIHAASHPGAPTPHAIALSMRENCAAPDGSAAALVLCAGEKWSPQTHALFPISARERATSLMLIGHQLSRNARFRGEEVAVFDLWTQHVMPHAVTR